MPYIPRHNPSCTLRNKDVVITSKRRHFDVITSKWRRFDVIATSLLRHVFSGKRYNTTCRVHDMPASVTDLVPPYWCKIKRTEWVVQGWSLEHPTKIYFKSKQYVWQKWWFSCMLSNVYIRHIFKAVYWLKLMGWNLWLNDNVLKMRWSRRLAETGVELLWIP